jgi:prevent-host-death family protein
MTIQINIAEAKAKLSELVARAEAGEEVVLARAGRAVATIQPVRRPKEGKRRLGVWEHLALDLPEDLFIGPDKETEAAADRPIFPPE